MRTEPHSSISCTVNVEIISLYTDFVLCQIFADTIIKALRRVKRSVGYKIESAHQKQPLFSDAVERY